MHDTKTVIDIHPQAPQAWRAPSLPDCLKDSVIWLGEGSLLQNQNPRKLPDEVCAAMNQVLNWTSVKICEDMFPDRTSRAWIVSKFFVHFKYSVWNCWLFMRNKVHALCNIMRLGSNIFWVLGWRPDMRIKYTCFTRIEYLALSFYFIHSGSRLGSGLWSWHWCGEWRGSQNWVYTESKSQLFCNHNIYICMLTHNNHMQMVFDSLHCWRCLLTTNT